MEREVGREELSELRTARQLLLTQIVQLKEDQEAVRANNSLKLQSIKVVVVFTISSQWRLVFFAYNKSWSNIAKFAHCVLAQLLMHISSWKLLIGTSPLPDYEK